MLRGTDRFDNKLLNGKSPIPLYGLVRESNLYRLSPEQAQAILDLRYIV